MAKKPVQFTFGEQSLRELEELATRLGITRSELIRHSLEVYKLLKDSSDQGGEILIKKGDDVQRLVGV